MRNLINILFFSIVLTACTSAPNNDGTFYADFPLTIELKGKTVPLDTVLFRYPDFRYLSSLGRRGEAPKEIQESLQKGITLPDGGQYIYVFSLSGEPLRKYVLDHFVYGISVNEQEGVIPATDVNRDDPIIEYRMK